MPLWQAWDYIEPSGYRALDLQTAKLIHYNWVAHRGSEGAPSVASLISPRCDWRVFDPALREEMDAEREIQKFESILKPDLKDYP